MKLTVPCLFMHPAAARCSGTSTQAPKHTCHRHLAVAAWSSTSEEAPAHHRCHTHLSLHGKQVFTPSPQRRTLPLTSGSTLQHPAAPASRLQSAGGHTIHIWRRPAVAPAPSPQRHPKKVALSIRGIRTPNSFRYLVKNTETSTNLLKYSSC